MRKVKPTWIIHCVIPEGEGVECSMDSHTHGLNAYDHPELALVMNLPQAMVGELLNEIGIRIVNGEKFSESGVYNNILVNDYPVELIKTEYKRGDEVMAIILPDENKKLPSDKDCSYPYNMQYEYLEKIKKSY